MGGRGSEPSHLIGRPGLSWGWGPPPMNGSQTVMGRESHSSLETRQEPTMLVLVYTKGKVEGGDRPVSRGVGQAH